MSVPAVPGLVVLAAGLSSRMKKSALQAASSQAALAREASERSKSMIGVGPGGRPILDYLLLNAREAGYRDVVLVVGPGDALVRERYGSEERNNRFHGLTISYAVQDVPAGRLKPLGTADALLGALRARPDWRGGRFTVCNSDNLYSRSVLERLLRHEGPCALIEYDASALRFDRDRIAKFGIIERDAGGFVTGIVEKPSPGDFARLEERQGSVGVSMNIFLLSYDLVYDCLEEVPMHPVRDEKELPLAVALLVKKHPQCMLALPASEYVPDLTSMGDITRVGDYLREHFPVPPFSE